MPDTEGKYTNFRHLCYNEISSLTSSTGLLLISELYIQHEEKQRLKNKVTYLNERFKMFTLNNHMICTLAILIDFTLVVVVL